MTAGIKRSCSANEVFHMARKACTGCGLAPDRAEDLATAVAMLQCSGYAGLSALYSLLVRYQDRAAEDRLALSPAADRLVVELLRPEAEGVAMLDWLVADAGMAEAEITELSDPLVMAGLLVIYAHSYGGSFELLGPGQTPLFSVAGPQDIADLPSLKDKRLRFRREADKTDRQPFSWQHSQTELTVWQALETLAHQTYVPASEASRQTGAGAGLVDND